jgi:hypothetical protein
MLITFVQANQSQKLFIWGWYFPSYMSVICYLPFSRGIVFPRHDFLSMTLPLCDSWVVIMSSKTSFKLQRNIVSVSRDGHTWSKSITQLAKFGDADRLDEVCKPESSHDMRFKTMLQKNEEAEHSKRNLRCDRTYEHVLNIVILLGFMQCTTLSSTTHLKNEA